MPALQRGPSSSPTARAAQHLQQMLQRCSLTLAGQCIDFPTRDQSNHDPPPFPPCTRSRPCVLENSCSQSCEDIQPDLMEEMCSQGLENHPPPGAQGPAVWPTIPLPDATVPIAGVVTRRWTLPGQARQAVLTQPRGPVLRRVGPGELQHWDISTACTCPSLKDLMGARRRRHQTPEQQDVDDSPASSLRGAVRESKI